MPPFKFSNQTHWSDQINTELLQIKKKGLFRKVKIPIGIDFASNDYLGFTRNHSIRKKLISTLQKGLPLGSTGSRLISGHSHETAEIEERLASIFCAESALIFGSGTLANYGVIGALGRKETEFFSDALNHASLIDAIRLTKSKYQIFKHNHMQHLEELLKKSHSQQKVIITESVFSMDGDLAPIYELEMLARKFNALLILDEAHATGVFGEKALGLAYAIRTSAAPFSHLVSIHPCGKALGGYGAFVCCPKHFKDFFINQSRSFIYTTALPPLISSQIWFSLEEMVCKKTHIQKLQKNIALSKKLFKNAGFSHTGSAIIPWIIGTNEKAISIEKNLIKKGLFVKAIRFPSVPENTARLRITLKSFHKAKDLKFLTQCLQKERETSL